MQGDSFNYDTSSFKNKIFAENMELFCIHFAFASFCKNQPTFQAYCKYHAGNDKFMSAIEPH